jgi:hypothetical protein
MPLDQYGSSVFDDFSTSSYRRSLEIADVAMATIRTATSMLPRRERAIVANQLIDLAQQLTREQ